VNIWTPSTFAQAGLAITDTTTPGRVFELSSEHHVRNEVKIDRAAHWTVAALQTEEERGESGFALPLEIRQSQDITIANFHSYRVVSSNQPFPEAISVTDSREIRFRNLHIDSDSKAAFDHAVEDATGHAQVRSPELAVLDVPGSSAGAGRVAAAASLKPEKLADGFFNISGAAVDGAGQLYFVDAHWQRIYRWNAAQREVELVRDAPLSPVNLAFDKAGDLLVTSYAGNGTVYWFRPDAPESELTLLKPEAAQPRTGMTAVLPVDYWSVREETTQPRPWQYVSPDGTVFLPAGDDFVQGQLYYGTKMADVLRAFGLARAVAGHPFYISDESYERTWRVQVDASGNFAGRTLFAERGGQGLAQDRAGNVYLAAGQIYEYSPDGKQNGTIAVPERPIQILFGGADRRTLFVLTQSALYEVRTAVGGL
jgi:sugar lactone lactonase YvrE